MAEQSATDLVRSLINDNHEDPTDRVFTDTEIAGFLQLEGGSVKLAAAQAIDTIADNEALTSKVIRTQGGVATDGAKVADSLRKRAAALREQAEDEAGGFFQIVPFTTTTTTPELTQRPVTGRPWWA